MTCIAAIADGETVWMGADRAVVLGTCIDAHASPKIFHNCGLLIGTAGDTRLGQVIEHEFIPPKTTRINETNVTRYIATEFINELRHRITVAGLMEHHDGREKVDGQILVGFMGRLFYISSWFSFIENRCGYDAIGSGQDHAKGVLYATCPVNGRPISPFERLTLALHAAEYHGTGVRSPFDIKSIPEPAKH